MQSEKKAILLFLVTFFVNKAAWLNGANIG